VPQIIQRVLRGRYALRYHRTADNRGLLTQVIHNAVRERAEACGWIPFLFFPDGITYLAPRNADEPELGNLPALIRDKLIQSVRDKLRKLVSRGPLGIKFAHEFVELLPPRDAGELLIQEALNIISDAKTPVTEERKAKTLLRKGSCSTLDLSYPASLSADRVAECMFALSKLLEVYYGASREGHGERLIEALGLKDCLPAFRSIEFTGGVGYPWYYMGGHFARANPGLSPSEMEERMREAYAAVVGELGEPEREYPFRFLDAYLPQVITLGSSPEGWDFGGELRRYEKNKAPRSGERICAICNSAFKTREDFSAFSNKKRISPKVESGRGICEVCQAEELLRRFSLGREMRAEGGTVFLHLYPTYFFTPVTGTAMRHAYTNLKNATFGDIIKPLQGNHFEIGALAYADVFQVLEPPNEKRRLDRVSYPEGDIHGYYLLGVPFLGKDPSDTESWAMPALLGLIIPIVLGVKVVVSPSSIPVYASGADFPSAVTLLDRPHAFWQHGMKRSRFGLSELELAIKAGSALYGLVSEAYRDGKGYPVWNQLGTVSRALDTDPLAVFGFADRIQQQAKGKGEVTTTEGMSAFLAKRLTDYYGYITGYYERILKEEQNKMGLIEGLVDHYAAFYRAKGRAAHARLRPLSLAAEAVLDSPPVLDRESLRSQVEGSILATLDRIANQGAEGWIPSEAWPEAERQRLVKEFAEYFLSKVFEEYCRGDRATLRQRLNRLKNGAEAVYVQKYTRRASENEVASQGQNGGNV
jgi:CRISPR-associated protein Csc3